MLYTGTSGFSYRHWNSVFYPAHVRDRLAYISQHLNSLEINSSFYNIPRPDTVARWSDTVPADFKLVLKAPRSVTHNRRLRLHSNAQRTGEDVLNYFVKGVLSIEKAKRGPVLIQISSKLQKDLVALREVLALFQAHSLRVALEIRHPSWYAPDCLHLLAHYGAALVSADWPAFSTPLVVTSDFIYVRRHGPVLYAGSYDDEQLLQDLEALNLWTKNHEVYVFFNNDGEGHAVFNALRMQKLFLEMTKGTP